MFAGSIVMRRRPVREAVRPIYALRTLPEDSRAEMPSLP